MEGPIRSVAAAGWAAAADINALCAAGRTLGAIRIQGVEHGVDLFKNTLQNDRLRQMYALRKTPAPAPQLQRPPPPRLVPASGGGSSGSEARALPNGVDPAWFMALPSGMQQEVLADAKRRKAASPGASHAPLRTSPQPLPPIPSGTRGAAGGGSASSGGAPALVRRAQSITAEQRQDRESARELLGTARRAKHRCSLLPRCRPGRTSTRRHLELT